MCPTASGEHGDTAAEVATRGSANDDDLLRYLAANRLSGRVATSIESALRNTALLLAGDPDYTFGLSDWKDTTAEEVSEAMAALGGDWAHREDTDGSAAIDPEATLAGIRSHARALAGFVAGGGGRVLVATGHPYGLLAHYAALARVLAGSGSTVLRPLAGRRNVLRRPSGKPCFIGYPDGVGALAYAGGLHHTHRADYMEAMLEEVGGAAGVDLVLADHGFAGAAIEAGIPTLSIADINDPGLPLAQARGRTDTVLLIDDGLEPLLFVPVTEAVLAGAGLQGRGHP